MGEEEGEEGQGLFLFLFFFFFFFWGGGGGGLLPLMPVPLGQLPSSVGSGVVTTAPSSLVCVVTFSAAAPVVFAVTFVSPADFTPEPGRKQCWVISSRERSRRCSPLSKIYGLQDSLFPRAQVRPLLPSHCWLHLLLLSQFPSHCGFGHSFGPLGLVFSFSRFLVLVA